MIFQGTFTCIIESQTRKKIHLSLSLYVNHIDTSQSWASVSSWIFSVRVSYAAMGCGMSRNLCCVSFTHFTWTHILVFSLPPKQLLGGWVEQAGIKNSIRKGNVQIQLFDDVLSHSSSSHPGKLQSWRRFIIWFITD